MNGFVTHEEIGWVLLTILWAITMMGLGLRWYIKHKTEQVVKIIFKLNFSTLSKEERDLLWPLFKGEHLK